ncbi:hypothetical protein ACV330_30090, partial [Pseudomonas aeruginosa]
HGRMPGMSRAARQPPAQAAPSQSRTPIPVPTEADRRAAFPPLEGHKVHDSALPSSASWYSNWSSRKKLFSAL